MIWEKALISQGGRWTVDDGRWTMDGGRWATIERSDVFGGGEVGVYLAGGLKKGIESAIISGRGRRTMDDRRRTMGALKSLAGCNVQA
jgi:hypothetical protein